MYSIKVRVSVYTTYVACLLPEVDIWMNEKAEDTIYKYAYVRCLSEHSYESLQCNKVKNLSDLESY